MLRRDGVELEVCPLTGRADTVRGEVPERLGPEPVGAPRLLQMPAPGALRHGLIRGQRGHGRQVVSEHPTLQAMALVLLTTDPDPEVGLRARQESATVCLAKTFAPGRLATQVDLAFQSAPA